MRLTCGALGFLPQAFYKGRARPCSNRDWHDAYLTNALVDLHAEDPEIGDRFLADELEGAGHQVGERRVWQLCRQQRIGLIGRHRARSQQLFAVVTGHGRVSGHDRQSKTIGPGYAALWDPGEEHDASSDEGRTAVCVEGEFEVSAISVPQDIVISDYDPTWPAWFDTVRHHVWPAVKDVALRVDHVGSTAMPGLAAKPIIDLDIVVASDHDVRLVIEQLATIGYRWRGDLGVASHWQPDVDLP